MIQSYVADCEPRLGLNLDFIKSCKDLLKDLDNIYFMLNNIFVLINYLYDKSYICTCIYIYMSNSSIVIIE